jgi:FMN phosphatase YigB (HAD superfamily)
MKRILCLGLAMWLSVPTMAAETVRYVALVDGGKKAGEQVVRTGDDGTTHVDFIFKQYPVFSFFDDAVYSYKVKASKPDREIYEIAVRQLGIKPEETFFIDDLLPNIETAKAMGFQTHHYHHDRHSALIEDLARAGVGFK